MEGVAEGARRRGEGEAAVGALGAPEASALVEEEVLLGVGAEVDLLGGVEPLEAEGALDADARGDGREGVVFGSAGGVEGPAVLGGIEGVEARRGGGDEARRLGDRIDGEVEDEAVVGCADEEIGGGGWVGLLGAGGEGEGAGEGAGEGCGDEARLSES